MDVCIHCSIHAFIPSQLKVKEFSEHSLHFFQTGSDTWMLAARPYQQKI
jgi:hypothetical protein